MFDKRGLTIVCLLSIVLALTACGTPSTPNPTPTPVPPTSTPTSEPTPTPTNEPTPTATPLPTATPEPFAVQDKAFEAEYENHKIDCENKVDVEIHLAENGELYFLFGGQMMIPLRGSDFVLWCYGAEHTWMGESTYAGYTFASDENNPLRFRVDKDAGYLYVSGEGAVTMPDGTRVTLPG